MVFVEAGDAQGPPALISQVVCSWEGIFFSTHLLKLGDF